MIIGVLGVIVAVLAWLIPFSPVGQSPLQRFQISSTPPGSDGGSIAAPRDLGTLEVPAYLADGVEYEIQQDGTYVVEILSGAYSPWIDNAVKEGQWRAFAYIYKNRAVTRGDDSWGHNVPIHPDFTVGCVADPYLQSKAEQCGRGKKSGEMVLRRGDRLRFVAMDEGASYSENREGLLLKITMIR